MIYEVIISLVTIVFSAGVSYGIVRSNLQEHRRDIDKLQADCVVKSEWKQVLSNLSRSIEELKDQNNAIDAKRESSTIAHQQMLNDIKHFMGRVEEFMTNNRI